MRFLGFILAYSTIWLLHLLPERVLWLVSDLMYVLLYRLFRYRRSVVFDNLSRAFPSMDEKEKNAVAGKFYHYLCDLILETAVSQFYGREQMLKRMHYKNPELLRDLHEQGKQVIGTVGHYGNWEFLTTLGPVSGYKILGAYKPLKNKWFDKVIRRNREKFNSLPVPMEKIARVMIQHYRDGIPALTVMLTDQRPMYRNIQYWTKFLGQDTPVYLGTEKLAKKIDAAVVFLKVRRIRRGRYEVEAELLCSDPGSTQPHEITDLHVKKLEELIREKPETWLWSHRRWKHSYEQYLKEKESRA
jgi:KDO2-lipid IV(A) lauroyltransferase